MPRILVADPLAEDGLERLRRAGEVTVVSKLGEAELIRRIPDFDALVVRSETRVTAPIIEAGSKLRVVGRAGVGVDNIDVGAATRKGILVVNAPRGNIVAAAEHAIALLFSLARWVPQADASVKRGEWTRAKFIGTEIRGKTLGVIGLGNVGSEVAKRAHGLEMDVVAYDPVVSIERAELFNVALVGLPELLEQADFVTVHVPLVDSNRNLIGAPELARMKPPRGAASSMRRRFARPFNPAGWRPPPRTCSKSSRPAKIRCLHCRTSSPLPTSARRRSKRRCQSRLTLQRKWLRSWRGTSRALPSMHRLCPRKSLPTSVLSRS